MLKVMKGRNLGQRLLYPRRMPFKFKGEKKSFTDKQKVREFRNTKPDLQQIVKQLLQETQEKEGASKTKIKKKKKKKLKTMK